MKVFYTPACGHLVPRIIDSVMSIDGVERGQFSGKTLAELTDKYPNLVVGDLDDVTRIKEDMMRTEPQSCTEDAFWEALECLPPMDWVRAGGGESFKMAERLSGRMTTIYARSGSSYWSFVDCDDLTHAAIMARVRWFGVRIGAPATRKQHMQDKYVDIPPELMGKADPDDQWIKAQLHRIDPSLIDYDTEYSVARATRALILELRDKLSAPKPDTGGPAFPSGLTEMDDDTVDSLHKGMTLRDYFAAKAMQAALMTAKPPPGNGLDEIVTQAADAAYKAADAMLKARSA